MFDSILSAMGLMRFKTIEVSFDPSANPEVVLDRDVNVRNFRVRWTRADESFEFKRMEDLESDKFPSVKVEPHQITCRNKNKFGDKSEYTIVVDYGGTEYNTSSNVPGDGDGDDDKPVIRN